MLKVILIELIIGAVLTAEWICLTVQEAGMFEVKYRNLTFDNRSVIGDFGDVICDYYDNLKKQTPQDTEEIKRVEDYMKTISGLDDVESAYNKIVEDTLDWAVMMGQSF